MKILFCHIILTLLFSFGLHAQNETAEELFEDGDFFFAREEYAEAAYLYRQVLNEEPENHNVHFKLGMAYLNIEGQEDKAIDHLLKATENTTLKYRKNYYPMKQAPHHAWFFLGNAYRINNQLAEALEAYEKFKSADDFNKHYNIRITEEEIQAVGRAKIIQDAALNIYKTCFEEPINTPGKEYKAIMAANERVLVWMNSQKFYEAVLMSVKQDGKWSNPINITPQIGSDGEMEPTGLSEDGTELLLVRRGQYDSDIYYSKYDGSFWSKAEPLKGDINSNFTEDHASFFPGEDSILLSSDRRGSVGGLDLYVSRKLADGTWSEPYNIGEEVNTEYDETAGYISPDGKFLVYSSEGHFNMGGFDIFKSEILENGEIARTFNIGYPINTTNDDTYFIPLKDGKSGIYSIWDDEGIGGRDIWFLEIIPQKQLEAKALTRLSNEDFTISVTDPETEEKITLIYDSVEDKITIRSTTGKEYNVVYSRNKHD